MRAAAKEFWDSQSPADWTPAEIEQLLTRSPWAKDASVRYNTGQSGPLSLPSARGSGRRASAASSGGPSGRSVGADIGGPWKATLRWESAQPIREASRTPAPADFDEFYVLNMLGNIPSVGVSAEEGDAAERKQKLELLQETTRIERRDDPLELKRIAVARGGTLFYFSRVFAIKPEDKQVTFVSKIGPLEIKCKFTLREMMYRGMLEL